MKYAYEDLSPDQFEKLIIFLCKYLLGTAVQGFSRGPDGGRDAKFTGTAENYPSRASPWSGIVIIQAKHTNGYNKHFSESDFFNPQSSHAIISGEIPKIGKLRREQKLDHYMLFSNRRLGGNSEEIIVTYISQECSLPKASICLCGVEQLDTWLKLFPQVCQLADIDPVDSPLIVSPDDLAEVIQSLKKHVGMVEQIIDHLPMPRVSYDRKNILNNMSEEYSKSQRKKYLKESASISSFLAAPENVELQSLYESIGDEFQFKIIAKRKNYQTFDEVLEHLIDLLFDRDPVLRNNKRLTRAMLFHMYWYCDIGVTDDTAAD